MFSSFHSITHLNPSPANDLFPCKMFVISSLKDVRKCHTSDPTFAIELIFLTPLCAWNNWEANYLNAFICRGVLRMKQHFFLLVHLMIYRIYLPTKEFTEIVYHPVQLRRNLIKQNNGRKEGYKKSVFAEKFKTRDTILIHGRFVRNIKVIETKYSRDGLTKGE